MYTLLIFSRFLWIPALLTVIFFEMKAIRQTKSLIKKHGLSLTTNYTGSIDYRELRIISGFPESKEMKTDVQKLIHTKSMLYSSLFIASIFIVQCLLLFAMMEYFEKISEANKMRKSFSAFCCWVFFSKEP